MTAKHALKAGIVLIAFDELVLLPFGLMVGAGWGIALVPPLLVAGLFAFMWAFGKAIEWVEQP